VKLADLVSIVMLLLVTWAMISPALQAYDYGDRKLELGLKLWVVWLFALSGIAGHYSLRDRARIGRRYADWRR
jgi:hypothetical protein